MKNDKKTGAAVRRPPRVVSAAGLARASGAPPVAEDSIAGHLRDILHDIGEDPAREGLVKTPGRYAAAIRYLTSGYDVDLDETIKDALFEVDCEEMVIVKDIEFYSLCEHHILPITGRAHVGYLPRKKVIGLSKVARVVDIFARRLQVQERMTTQIASGLMRSLDALGVGVVIEAVHYCMIMRGVQKQQSATVTSAMLGAFREDNRTRAEFMQLIKGA